MKSPIESKIVKDMLAAGKPFLIAQYATGKVTLGKRVAQEAGKVEFFGQYVHGLIVDREVVKVTQRMDEGATKLALGALPKLPDGSPDIDADLPRDKEDMLLGVKPGESCVLQISTYIWEEGARKKMSLRMSGRVLPL